MKKVWILAMMGFLALGTGGCFHHSYTTGTGGNVSNEPAYNEWHSHWLFGIIGEENVDIKKVCASGNATIKDGQSFVNGLIGSLIGIVWYPTTVKVYCDGALKASFDLTPETMRKIALRSDVLREIQMVSPRKAEELAAAIDSYEHKRARTALSTGPITHQ